MLNKVYVFGNGPSLKNLDFANLKGIDTLGMNAAYKYWNKINWFPTYYCCLDDVVILCHQDEIYKIIESNKVKKFFLHDNILKKYPELKNNNKIMLFNSTFNKDKSNIFYNNFVTTGSYSIRWMISLGYNCIGVLGIDCNYVEQINGSKNIDGLKMKITDNVSKNPNYFFDDYQQINDLYNIPNNPECKVIHSVHLDSVNRIFDDCERLNINVKIINTTFDNNMDFSNVMSINNFLNLDKHFDFNDSKCFNLLTTLYENINNDRMDELFECFKNNYLNHYIKKIYVFFESQRSLDDILKYININYNKLHNLIVKQKFEIIPVKTRPTYYDYFAFSESHLPNSKIIISNTDIYFDNSLDKIYDYDLTNKFFLLSRKFKSLDDNKLYLPMLGDVQYPWKKIDLNKSISNTTFKKHKLFSNENYCCNMDWIVYDNGNTKIKYNDNLTIEIENDEYLKYFKHKPDDRKSFGKVTYDKLREKVDIRNEFTQDTWIFNTPFKHYKNINTNIELGTYKCDTLIAYNFINYCIKNPNLKISNPCLSINCIHVDNLNTNKKDNYDDYKKNFSKELLKELYDSYIPWSKL